MARCPNCDRKIAWDVSKCPGCSAEFTGDAVWHPMPESPEEAKQLKTHFPDTNWAEPDGGIGRIALGILALGIAFGISAWLSPGGRILGLFLDVSMLQSFGPVKVRFLGVFANYWVPAIIMYLVLRAARLDTWIKPRGGAMVLIGVADALLVCYVAARVLASGIQGGGPSFVIASFAPLVVYPSWLLLGGGFLWLAVTSARGWRSRTAWRSVTVTEAVVLLVFLAAPAHFGWQLVFAEDGPIRMARAAKSLFEIRCKSTGEKLLGPVIEEVQGVYFEPDGGSHYDRIQGQGGVYSSSGSSILGEPMVNSGWLLFFERKNYRSSAPGETPALYTRHYLKDGKGQPVNDLESRYGVLARNLETEAEKKFGVHGVEIRIVDLKTDETIATTSYFISTRHRRFCGDAPDGNFSASSFVTRSLGLKRQFPSAFPARPETK